LPSSAAIVLTTTEASAIVYAPAPFFQQDTRFYSGDGDWSPWDFKAECSQSQKLSGISATPIGVSPSLRAHVALCETSTDTLGRGTAVQHTHSLRGPDDRADTATNDWDPGYYKAECAATEAATGVSQGAGALHMSKILCSPIESPTENDDAACTALPFSHTSDDRLSSASGDWSPGYSKNECAPNQFLKGVSSNPSTGEIHAILCCDSKPFFPPWAPSSALLARLQVLGQLPTTETTIANAAYFKDVPFGPAMSVALALADGPFYTQGFGNACTFVQGVGNACAGEPSADTAYYIASSTKVFTAAAMLRLFELYPSVHLDDLVSSHYSPLTVQHPPPPVPGGSPSCPLVPMTLRHLITHASGLPNVGGNAYPGGMDIGEPTRDQFDQMAAAVPLEFYPGCNRDYSGVGIAVAGRVIEKVANETYAQFMSSQLLAPLGMTRSLIDPATLPSGTFITEGVRKRFESGPRRHLHGDSRPPPSARALAGGWSHHHRR
jgi:hypothetical protein